MKLAGQQLQPKFQCPAGRISLVGVQANAAGGSRAAGRI
jgi:hypothetical protein